MTSVLNQLKSLVDRDGIARDYVQFRIAVLDAQCRALDAIQRLPAARQRPGPGDRIGPETAPLDTAVAGELVDRVLQAAPATARSRGPARRLAEALRREPSLLEGLVRHGVIAREAGYVDALARKLAVPGDLLLLAARLVAAPLVASYGREPPGAGETERWGSGQCPRCGAAPGLASLVPPDGRRHLHCSLCGASWRFARLACPHCPADAEPRLERLVVDQQPARWIEACTVCRRYLKVVDRRQLAADAEFSPLAEDVSTLHLDLVAQDHGFAANPPYAALV